MPAPRENSPDADLTFDADLKTAETLLFEIARELRHVSFEERTLALHIAALAAKSRVALWPIQPPGPEERRRAIEELIQLQDDVRRR